MKPTIGILALWTIGLSACLPTVPERCSDGVSHFAQTRALASIARKVPVDFGENYQEPIFVQCGDIVKVSFFLRDVDGLPALGGDVHYHVRIADGTIVKTEIGE